MRLVCIALMACIVLTGCLEEDKETPWEKIRSSAALTLSDASTPDTVVKEWWKARDAQVRFAAEACRELQNIDPAVMAANQLTDGVVKEGVMADRFRCAPLRYSREVLAVDVQSDTMSFVLAAVKNVTEPDSGWDRNVRDVEIKERGSRFRYALTRTTDTEPWRISDIQELTAYQKNWTPVYKAIEPSGNIYVFGENQ